MKIKNPFVSWMEMDRAKLNQGLGLASVGLGFFLCSFSFYLLFIQPFFVTTPVGSGGITIMFRGLVFILLGLILSKGHKKLNKVKK